LILLASCSSSQSTPPPTLSTTTSRIPEEAIGRRYGVASVSNPAPDPSYGRSETSPVPVGGGFGEGSHNTYRYLNALLGPKGQEVHYTRVGTCCAFDAPNAPFGGKGLLEVYEIAYEGGTPVRLYFNWYASGELLVPQELTARR
jgi:hypothetical protein